MQLSKRLAAVASFVDCGSTVADIGCDHAYTSIYIAENKISLKVIAMDINAGPVNIAKNNVKVHGMQKYIEVRQSDGLKGISIKDNVDTVIISGMGGNLVCSILQSNDEVINNVNTLILQPQSDIYRVRHFLHDNGFKITAEKMVTDGGKYYTVIKAARGTQTFINEYEYIYGKYLIDTGDEILMDYLKKLYMSNIKIINRLSGSDSDIHIDRCRELKCDNMVISGILKNRVKGGKIS